MSNDVENSGHGEESPHDDPKLTALLENVGLWTRQLQRTELWSVTETSRPLHTLLDDPEEVRGKLRRRDRHAELLTHDFKIMKVDKAGGPCFRLQVDGFPADFSAVGLVLGQFDFWKFEPVTATYVPPFVEGPPVAGSPRDAEQITVLSGATKSTARANEPIELDDGGPISATYNPDPEVADVDLLVRVPEDRDGAFVVVECKCTGADGKEDRQLRGVHLNQEPVGASKGAARFFAPKPAPGTAVEITVRGFTSDDLPLLNPKEVHQLLADSKFLTIPASETDAGIDFVVRWDDQRDMVAQANTCWALQVAPRAEGA